MTNYPLVRLGEVLTPARGEVAVEPHRRYQTAGIYSHGKGLFVREPMLGAETKYGCFTRLRQGQLVFARLSAWEGAVAIVPLEFDGAYVSQEFPVLDVDKHLADAGYLAWICRWSDFWDALMHRSRGLGGRVGVRRLRVHPEQLLSIEVPLPHIEEQQRVAAKLNRVGSATERLLQCARRWEVLQAALIPALAQRYDLSDEAKRNAGWQRTCLGDVMAPANSLHQVQSDGTYPNVGIFSFARGLFEKSPIDGSTTSARTLTRIRSGQLIYSRLFAFEGAYAEVTSRFDGYFVSNEFPTFDVDGGRTSASFIAAYLKSPSTWADLASSSKGLGVRRQRLHVDTLLKFPIWLPPLKEQQHIVSTISKISQCGERRQFAGEALAALQSAVINRAFAGLL